MFGVQLPCMAADAGFTLGPAPHPFLSSLLSPQSQPQAPADKAKCRFVSDVLAGPTGKVLLMPEDPNAVYIMVATGTGIAPYRAYWRRQFLEDVPNYKFTGLSWLFMGVANSDAKLYDDELQQILKEYPDQ